MFFKAFTVPPAEIVLLYPFCLTIFSVMEPTQKHILLLSWLFKFKFLIALALVKINASYFFASTGIALAAEIFKVGMWIILAAAGVKSLHLNDKIGLSFKTEDVLPAVGQGIIAVQCNKNDDEVKNLLRSINDTETEICAKSERAMLQAIEGDCETAVGGLAIIESNNLKLTAQLFSDSGLKSFEYEMKGKTSEAVNIGKSVGEKLLKLAGSEFKKKWIF